MGHKTGGRYNELDTYAVVDKDGEQLEHFRSKRAAEEYLIIYGKEAFRELKIIQLKARNRI